MATKPKEDMQTERIIRAVEPYRAYNSKLIAGVWIIDRRLVDVVADDGTTYTMDYGIKEVLAKTTFPGPLRADSKRVREEIAKFESIKDTW